MVAVSSVVTYFGVIQLNFKSRGLSSSAFEDVVSEGSSRYFLNISEEMDLLQKDLFLFYCVLLGKLPTLRCSLHITFPFLSVFLCSVLL